MKKLFVFLCICLPFILNAQTAKIKIDIDRTTGEIGPKDKRPARIYLAWGGVDNNHVGTDEWIALNNEITADIMSSPGDFSGKAEATAITSGSLEDPFTYDKKGEYIPASIAFKTERNRLSCSFPPHSFTQIKTGFK
jgi:hypothetical protein